MFENIGVEWVGRCRNSRLTQGDIQMLVFTTHNGRCVVHGVLALVGTHAIATPFVTLRAKILSTVWAKPGLVESAMDGPAQLMHLDGLRKHIERALSDMLPECDHQRRRVNAAMRYAVLTPGKRVRPMLALLSAGQLGCPTAMAMPGALALELVHAASLVLDDLPCMDDAPERRGQPSVHVRFGQDVAVLTGIALLNEAFAVISRATHLSESARCEMIALLSRTVGLAGLVGGQDKDLLGAPPTPGLASEMHHEKTGVLFIASVEMGALAAGAEPDVRAALRAFGAELGLAFQAMDDLDDKDDIEDGRDRANLISVLGVAGVRREAA
ncbi:MAG: polyprenyl synthetase family protein, partial [Oxalobacteraceae bacterium]